MGVFAERQYGLLAAQPLKGGKYNGNMEERIESMVFSCFSASQIREFASKWPLGRKYGLFSSILIRRYAATTYG
jgi:hypothetical protein